jgi:hypothetical protein
VDPRVAHQPSSRGAGGYRRVLTDGKSLLALRGVGAESKAESVRFHGRRVTKVGGSQTQLPSEGLGALNKGCERRTQALPDVSDISLAGRLHDANG